MLKEISCDKFIENGKVREPIQLHSGLNAVLGSNDGANSIGKSTFLLIIDFIFGGSDYVNKATDVIENIGNHTIKFQFRFKNKNYYFSRSTENSAVFNLCDADYNILEQYDKEAYCNFLKQQYGMTSPFISLRSSVSPFIRVWGRDTLDENKPLKAFKDAPDNKGIDVLLKLFNRYSEIEVQKQSVQEAKAQKKAFEDAQKYKYVIAVENKTAYKDNEKRIQELESELHQLSRESNNGLVDLDSLQAQQLAELRHQLSDAKRQRTKLVAQKRSFEAERNPQKQQFAKDFELLQEFFPEVNLKKLTEIEHFHQQLATVLKNEYNQSAKELQAMINYATKQVEHLEEKISQISNVPNVAQSILDQYAKLQKEITQLKESNHNFNTKERLKEKLSSLTQAYNALIRNIFSTLQNTINSKMAEVNHEIYNGAKTAPQLTFRTASTYNFFTPQDRGTGSEYKGLIVFDLVLLMETSLPILVHDSVLLKQIQDNGLEGILKVYTQQDKQIFIALDKEESYSETSQKLLQEAEVLRLYSNGGELFGRAWNN
ncbi:TPA: DUF2326 domain-containing protein, partial [Streptococcus suis]